MSLHRQLLLAIIVSIALAFAGSLAATMLAARSYHEEQLAVKNSDNAAALALAMSQLGKDRATIELQLISLFETGQYESIRVLDTRGAVVAERSAHDLAAGAPDWFVRLLPIVSKPGTGQIGDGFRQFGTVQVKSVAAYASRDLYRSARNMLFGFAAAACVLSALAAVILARIRKPLQRVVEQAQGILERRYLIAPPPAVPELRSLGEAMNLMVERIKSMFEEEACRLEAMRQTANLDELTHLANRGYFMNRLHGALDVQVGSGGGVLLLFRLRDLAGINLALGRAETDALIRRVAEVAAQQANGLAPAVVGRLNGADFAILLPGGGAALSAAGVVVAALNAIPQPWRQQAHPLVACAATTYIPGEEVGPLMARLDHALATAEGNEEHGCVEAPQPDEATSSFGNREWREKLLHALEKRRIGLDLFETRAFDGRLSHRECFVRLRLDEGREWLPAARFLPHVARLNLTADFDLAVAREMAHFGGATDMLALNLSPDSLGAPGFGARLAAIIAAAPGLAQRIWIDAPEKGVFQFFAGFNDLLQRMKALGCRVGVDHFGHEFDRIGQLYGLGLDYVKIDASFINGLADSPGNRNFLKGVCSICHNMGMEIHALGVATAEDLAVLPGLGFDAATGPALKD